MSAELRNIAVGMIFGSTLLLLSFGYLANLFYGVTGHQNLPDPVIEGSTEAVSAAGGTAPAAPVEIASLMASADAGKGAKLFKKKCLSCHTSEQGGKAKTGPNLFDITKRGIAKTAGFKYSTGMKKKAAEQWTDENLSIWLLKPTAFAPKNKMSFAGLRKAKDRANLIAFLKANGS